MYFAVPDPWDVWIRKQVENHPEFWPMIASLDGKEKFGELRLHYSVPEDVLNTADERDLHALEEFIQFLEEGCAQLCAVCGATGATPRWLNSWVLPMCDDHGVKKGG